MLRGSFLYKRALLLRGLSSISLIISAFMITPVIVALIYHETELISVFLFPALGISAISVVILIFTKREKQTYPTRDKFLMVTLAWVLASLIGAIPYTVSGLFPSFVDALFESTSGFTTTGSSILTDVESLPRSILFWRSMTHWLGGVGIVVFMVAVLPILGVSGLQLMKAEAPGPYVEQLTPRIIQTAQILWLIYTALTVMETVLLLFGGMDLFDALTHSFGTVATGGFSPRNLSIAAYENPFIHWVITAFMILSGINFVIYYRLVTGNIGYITRNSEFRAYIITYFVAVFIVSLSLSLSLSGQIYKNVFQSIRYGAFQVATLMTSTGYTTANYEVWPTIAQSVLFLMLFIGGSTGSTSGGIKMLHVVTLFKLGVKEGRALINRKRVFPLRINRKTVTDSFVNSVSSFVFFYIFLVLISSLIVSSSGSDIITSLTASLAVIGNIGPGFGRVGPTGSFAFFPDYVKLWLSAIMIIGRLEIFTVLVIFTPRFWKS